MKATHINRTTSLDANIEAGPNLRPVRLANPINTAYPTSAELTLAAKTTQSQPKTLGAVTNL